MRDIISSPTFIRDLIIALLVALLAIPAWRFIKWVAGIPLRMAGGELKALWEAFSIYTFAKDSPAQVSMYELFHAGGLVVNAALFVVSALVGYDLVFVRPEVVSIWVKVALIVAVIIFFYKMMVRWLALAIPYVNLVQAPYNKKQADEKAKKTQATAPAATTAQPPAIPPPPPSG